MILDDLSIGRVKQIRIVQKLDDASIGRNAHPTGFESHHSRHLIEVSVVLALELEEPQKQEHNSYEK